jgi:hypothetical protein
MRCLPQIAPTASQRSQLPQPKPVAQPNPSQLGNIFLLTISVVGLVTCDLLPALESRLTTSIWVELVS